jgi:hypothetical protein
MRLYDSALSYFIGGKTSKITKFVEWCFRISSLRLSLVAAAHSTSTLRTSAFAVVIIGSSDGYAFQADNACVQPLADGDKALDRTGAFSHQDAENRTDSASRLKRNVGRARNEPERMPTRFDRSIST